MSSKKRVTINDVAMAAGVSKTTVSRYINGHPELMSEKTRERIRTVIEMTNYHPSDIASNLKKRTTNLIGLLIADILSFFLCTDQWSQQILGQAGLYTADCRFGGRLGERKACTVFPVV